MRYVNKDIPRTSWLVVEPELAQVTPLAPRWGSCVHAARGRDRSRLILAHYSGFDSWPRLLSGSEGTNAGSASLSTGPRKRRPRRVLPRSWSGQPAVRTRHDLPSRSRCRAVRARPSGRLPRDGGGTRATAPTAATAAMAPTAVTAAMAPTAATAVGPTAPARLDPAHLRAPVARGARPQSPAARPAGPRSPAVPVGSLAGTDQARSPLHHRTSPQAAAPEAATGRAAAATAARARASSPAISTKAATRR